MLLISLYPFLLFTFALLHASFFPSKVFLPLPFFFFFFLIHGDMSELLEMAVPQSGYSDWGGGGQVQLGAIFDSPIFILLSHHNKSFLLPISTSSPLSVSCQTTWLCHWLLQWIPA